MKPQYENWINDFKQRHNNNVNNLCKMAVHLMAKDFPELIICRGFAHVFHEFFGNYKDQHWWLTTTTGDIVDPTASQYIEVFEYEPYDEDQHGPEPTGKCMDCGEYVFDYKYFCSSECERRTREFMGFR